MIRPLGSACWAIGPGAAAGGVWLSGRREYAVANFNPEHKAVLDDLLLDNPLVRPGVMFGFPAYYVGKKL